MENPQQYRVRKDTHAALTHHHRPHSFVPKEFAAIAMDSASATTGPVNIPLNMAIAIGLAKSLENVDPLTSGFGIVGLTSVGAIISVMVLGLLMRI
jgi:hypothetical protein